MKQDLAQLHEKNTALLDNIQGLTANNIQLQGSIENLSGENVALREKFEDLSVAVQELQSSEKEIKDLVQKLTLKIQDGGDQELKDQIAKLEQLYTETQIEIKTLLDRIKTLESGNQQAPTSGIFTYIEKEQDQTLFIQAIEEALNKEMTYAQIDEFLSASLPKDLDKIIKDHPALTKNYIRDLRKD